MFRLFRKKYPEKFSGEIVNSHPVFAGFNRSQYSDLGPYFQDESFAPDSELTISAAGDTFFAIIKDGVVEVKETLSKTGRKNSVTLSRGQSFGELNIVDPGFSVLECRFIEPSDLLILSHKNFRDMTDKNYRSTNIFYLNLSNIISEQLVILNKEYLRLFYENVIEAQRSK